MKMSPQKNIVNYSADPLTEQGISTLMAIERESFHHGPRKSKDGYRKCITNPEKYGDMRTLRRAHDGLIVGYIHIKRLSKTALLLCNMAAGSIFRGQGVARFALSWLRQVALSQKAHQIILHVRASNEQAISCYRKSGYVEAERKSKGYRNGKTEADHTKVTMVLSIKTNGESQALS
jgi:ribosomal protein S18 acetylase RimI-like enzyme